MMASGLLMETFSFWHGLMVSNMPGWDWPYRRSGSGDQWIAIA
jgi:hypothetical protein